jgi:2-polyprenyl-6-hydroxyphenyl methylase/3-demethylubiquinone-9 3-methyltransferase
MGGVLQTVKDGALDAALTDVEAAVRADGHDQDLSYLMEHRARIRRTLQRVCELRAPGAVVLDIGSHYLHLSSALAVLGFDVVAMDVSAFAAHPAMVARGARFGIRASAVDRIDTGDFLSGLDGTIDCVIFTEILEHITFNPVLFWRRVYELMSVGGLIYLTTPNALTPWQMLHQLKTMATLKGIGLSPSEIFYTVTYGHHWKLYSTHEVVEYFGMLSPDFDVEVSTFNFPTSSQGRSLKDGVRNLVRGTASAFPVFRDQIEAVIRLKARTRWAMEPLSIF